MNTILKELEQFILCDIKINYMDLFTKERKKMLEDKKYIICAFDKSGTILKIYYVENNIENYYLLANSFNVEEWHAYELVSNFNKNNCIDVFKGITQGGSILSISMSVDLNSNVGIIFEYCDPKYSVRTSHSEKKYKYGVHECEPEKAWKTALYYNEASVDFYSCNDYFVYV